MNDQESGPPIVLLQDGPVPELRLSRSHRRNAIDRELLTLADAAITTLEERGVTVALLAADPPTFCAGNDLSEMDGDLRQSSVIALTDRLLRSSVLWVAAVEGPALGGGLALLAACPLVVASSTASFALPERDLGLFPSGVMPYLEVVLPLRTVWQLGVSGEPIDAGTAQTLGLVSELVRNGSVRDRAKEVALRLRNDPQLASNARRAWQSAFGDVFFARRHELFSLLPTPASVSQPTPERTRS